MNFTQLAPAVMAWFNSSWPVIASCATTRAGWPLLPRLLHTKPLAVPAALTTGVPLRNALLMGEVLSLYTVELMTVPVDG